MSEPLRYPIPWPEVAGLWRHIARGSQTSVDRFTADVAARILPPPRIVGALPSDPRFVLASNHYQRRGLWILHTAAVLTRAVRQYYGPGDPPVRWLVTANWPRLRLGPFSVPSPGDWLLPRVAHALSCYPVSFHGTNPAFTARSLRRLLRDARSMKRPVGIFPEGAAGLAGEVGPALPGVGRLLVQLGLPVVPAGVSEDGRFVVRFGQALSAAELSEAGDAAGLVMSKIRELAPAPPGGRLQNGRG